MYKTVRTVHLLLASAALPFLLIYGLSAVQMSHQTWFTLTPLIRESVVVVAPGLTDARAVAREVTRRAPAVRGELTGIRIADQDITMRLGLPGTVHDVRYRRASGEARVKTSTGGTMAVFNRLHHAAGLWHEPAVLRAWGLLVGVISAALLLTGATGLAMWFMRRTERRTGAVLLAVHLAIVIGLLVAMRSAGP